MEALERAEHANRAKSEFLARITHEFRTPLIAIIGMTQLAQSTKDPEKLRDSLSKIDDASRQLLRHIDDVLEMSIMGYDAFKLNEDVFSFHSMIDTVAKTVETYASEKEQSLRFNIGQSIPERLIGDEKRLAQVLNALLANAIKYTPNLGEIGLAASVLDKADGIITLQFRITDTGIGISEENQSGIFDLFEQADGSISRKHRGIGLGLPLSRRVIEMMGGDIWVESEVGKGSVFVFTCKCREG
jgi:signal transduction histidine kinase